jgi:sugar fermentation stimulation protein A
MYGGFLVKIADKLHEGLFVSRLNRFVGEVDLNGDKILCHILNPGRMVHFLKPGTNVLLAHRPSPTRKIPYSLIYVVGEKSPILIDSQIPNSIFFEALQARLIPQFAETRLIEKERPYGHDLRSKIDFLLDQHIFIEIKSSNYEEKGIGYFPDAPSLRAQKHVKELIEVLEKNDQNQAWVIFLAQRTDVSEIRPLDKIDPEFGRLVRYGVKKGVKTAAFMLDFLNNGCEIRLGKELPVNLEEYK